MAHLQRIDPDCLLNGLPFYGEAQSLVRSLVETVIYSRCEYEKEEAIEDLNCIMVEHVTVALALQEIIKNARERS
jgi:hypothetical protein